MSEYPGLNNLNDLAPATPLDGASQAELVLSIRQIKRILKNVLLASHTPVGTLRPVASSGLADNVISTAKLVDLAITTAKLAALAVTAEKLAADSVTTTKIADGAVTAAKLAAGAVGASAYQEASIPLSALAAALGSANIKSHASNDSLRAIGSNHIKNSAITNRMIADMAFSKLTGGTAGTILVRGVSGWEAVTPTGGLTYNPSTHKFSIESPATAAYFGDSKARGSHGGGTTAATWVQRDLGELEDGRGLMTFFGNTFKLDQGSYFFYARCPVNGAVGTHQARLFRDNGDATNVISLWGSSEECAAGMSGASVIQGTLEVTSDDWLFEIQHACANSVATTGFGKAVSSDNTVSYGNHAELYTTGYVLKLT